jgi:hypothetical protein
VGFNPASLFGAAGLGDYWEVDADTGTVDATVQNLVGKRDQHTFTQGTAGSRPTLKQRSDGVHYLDGAAKSMSVSSSQALFKYLHDGTGGTIIALVEWPSDGTSNNFLASATGSATSGLIISKATTTQQASVSIARSASGVLAATGSEARMPLASGRLSMFRVSYKNNGGADDLKISFDIGRDVLGIATANAPNAGNSGQSLTWSNVRLYALLVIDRELTQDEQAQVYRHWMGKYRYRLPAIDAIGLLIGQSNNSSRGLFSSTLVQPLDGVFTFPKHEEFIERAAHPLHSVINQAVATVPTEPQNPLVGPGLSMGRGIKADGGKNVVLVPAAVGTTTIADWNVPGDLGNRAKLFGAAVYRAQRAKALAGGAPIFIFCVGHEGSASLAVPDYTAGGVGSGYQDAFSDYIANLRSALGEDAPLVLAQLGSHTTLSTSVSQAAAGEAQRQLEATIPNCVVIPAHDLQLLADGIHYTATSAETLAARAAVAARKLVFGESLTVGPRLVSASRSGGVVTVEFDVAVNESATDYGDLFRVWDNGVEATVASAVRNADPTKIDIDCTALTGSVTWSYGFRAGSSSAARTDVVTDGSGNLALVCGPLLVA